MRWPCGAGVFGYPRKERLPSADPRLVVVGRAADLVIGLEEGLAQERANVPAAQPIDHALPLSLAHDEAGETQLGQMLAGHRRSTPGGGGEARHVEFRVAKSPEHAHPRRVSEQRERRDRGGYLAVGQVVRMVRCAVRTGVCTG